MSTNMLLFAFVLACQPTIVLLFAQSVVLSRCSHVRILLQALRTHGGTKSKLVLWTQE